MAMTTSMVWGSEGSSKSVLQFEAIAKEHKQLQAQGATTETLDALKRKLDILWMSLTQNEKDEVAKRNSQTQENS